MNKHRITTEVLQRLEKAGSTIITVTPGEFYQRTDSNAYVIDPCCADDYQRLLRDVRQEQSNWRPEAILHLWSLSSLPDPHHTRQLFDDAQHAGFFSLIFLAQALERGHVTNPVAMWIVSTGLHEVESKDKVNPNQAPILGASRVIPQEYRNINCSCIDITPPPAETKEEDQLIDALVAELLQETPDRTIALRERRRWVQDYQRIHVQNADAGTTRLRESGTYLITGGLGQIGLTLAEYLARTHRAKLILVGRSSILPRSEWDEWFATHDESDRVFRTLRKLEQLESFGSEILLMQADVADETQMESVITQAHDHFGKLHGVIHAAGLGGRGVAKAISETDYEACWQHFNAKVRGVVVLAKVLQGESLDFCMLTSSIASILGGLGFAAYTAANLFMDAFALEQNRMQMVPWISVNWDRWLEETSESAHGSTVAGVVTPADAEEIFRRVLSSPELDQVIISTADLQTRLDKWIGLDVAQPSEAATSSETSSLHPRPELTDHYVAPRNDIERAVVQLWQELLGIEQIGAEDDFFELGGHSLMATQVISCLRDLFQVDLELRTIFDMPTPAALSMAIVQKRAHQVVPIHLERTVEGLQRLTEDEVQTLLDAEPGLLVDGGNNV